MIYIINCEPRSIQEFCAEQSVFADDYPDGVGLTKPFNISKGYAGDELTPAYHLKDFSANDRKIKPCDQSLREYKCAGEARIYHALDRFACGEM